MIPSLLPTLLPILGSALAGVVLAAVYFGGLWWTVRRLPNARRPAIVYFSSLALRLAILLSGACWALSALDAGQLIACFIAFLAGRNLLVGQLGPSRTAPPLADEAL